MSGATIVPVVAAAIMAHGRCLIAQRGPGQKLAFKWEFPGGKVEALESPREALVREIREELGVVVETGEFVGATSVVNGAVEVRLELYAAAIVCGELAPTEHAEVRWVSADEMSGFDWAEADVPLVVRVAGLLRQA